METMHASYKKGLNYFASSVSWSFLVSVVDTYIKVYSIVKNINPVSRSRTSISNGCCNCVEVH